MPTEESKVFISYSHEDADFALRLGKDLKSKGLNIYLDQIDIKPSDHWDREVEKALRASGKFLIILTPSSVSSDNVMDELSYALKKKKIIIPVLYIDCEIPFRIDRIQHSDFTKDYDLGLNDLLRAFDITNIIAKEETTKLPKVDASGPAKEDLKQKEEKEAELKRKQAEEQRVKEDVSKPGDLGEKFRLEKWEQKHETKKLKQRNYTKTDYTTIDKLNGKEKNKDKPEKGDGFASKSFFATVFIYLIVMVVIFLILYPDWDFREAANKAVSFGLLSWVVLGPIWFIINAIRYKRLVKRGITDEDEI